MSFPAPSPRAIPRVRSSPSRVYHACDHASTDFESFLKVDEDIQVVGPVQTESDHVYTSAAGRRPCVPGYLGTCVLSVKPGGSWEAVWSFGQDCRLGPAASRDQERGSVRSPGGARGPPRGSGSDDGSAHPPPVVSPAGLPARGRHSAQAHGLGRHPLPRGPSDGCM